MNLPAGPHSPIVCAPSQQCDRFKTCEKRGTHDRELRAHQEQQQGSLHLSGFTTFGFIFLEFIPHTGSTLETWLCDFLIFCMRQLEISTIGYVKYQLL